MSLRGRAHKGVVTTWVDEKGYGFISPNDGKLGDLFVHVDAIVDRSIKNLKRGDRVRFDVELNTNPTKNSGKKFAVNVELLSNSGGRKDRSRDREDRDRDRGKSRSRSRSRSRRSRSKGRGGDRSRSRSRSRRGGSGNGGRRNSRSRSRSGRKRSPSNRRSRSRS